MLAGLAGIGLAAGRGAGFLALGAARRTAAFLAGFFAGFLRAAGRFAGAFLRLGFAFFLAGICDLLAGTPLDSKERMINTC
jgi:predicted phage tail protein